MSITNIHTGSVLGAARQLRAVMQGTIVLRGETTMPRHDRYGTVQSSISRR